MGTESEQKPESTAVPCILGRKIHDNRSWGDPLRECTLENCQYCAWSPAVAAERERLLRENGLTECEDGLKRLLIPARPKPETDNK